CGSSRRDEYRPADSVECGECNPTVAARRAKRTGKGIAPVLADSWLAWSFRSAPRGKAVRPGAVLLDRRLATILGQCGVSGRQIATAKEKAEGKLVRRGTLDLRRALWKSAAHPVRFLRGLLVLAQAE